MLYLYARTEVLLVMTELDFTKINRELSMRAGARKQSSRPLKSFDSFFCTEYLSKITECYLNEASSLKDIDYYFTLHDKGIKLFVKKLIRKANKFLFLRNIEQQRNFNNALLQANLLLYRKLDALQCQYERDMNALKKKLSERED